MKRLALAWTFAAWAAASPAAAFDPTGVPILTGSAEAPVAVEANPPYGRTAAMEYNSGGIFDEIRLGGSAFTKSGDIPDEEDGAFVHGELYFDPLWGRRLHNAFLDALVRPRPHLGATVSTDDGTNQFFGGVTWHFPIGEVFFVEASFGGTVHDGELRQEPGTTDVQLGCRVLFRESAALGFNLGRHWRVLGFVDHASHASLCDDENDGLTHVGGLIGYRF